MQLFSRIEGSGRPLLILHGFLGLSDNWKTLSAQYAAAGFEVHVPDLRNHGRSPHSNEFSYEAMTADIYDYCEAHNLKNVSVIGHSMGGKIAMFFAVAYPEMLDKLIVADIGPKYYAPHHQDILAGLQAIDFAAKPDRKEVDASLAQFVPDFGTRQFLLKSLYWIDPGQLAWRFNLAAFLKNDNSIGEALPENAYYEKPVLFLRGAKSGYINDVDIASIIAQFPIAQFETIANSGHWVHAENPVDFFEKTMAFLKA